MAGVTDEECEVELHQDFCRDDGGISWFGGSIVWIWSLGLSICSIGVSIRVTVGSILQHPIRGSIRLAICSHSLLG